MTRGDDDKQGVILTNTREIALMIQLEQQQHGEFWVGGVGWWVGWVTYQLPISSSLCGWIKNKRQSIFS